ncbi:conserved Plasmodium protein, unknown function [Plasmodium gonderi]|uniref:Uncharacterized protein n=1 Tax=Plasmodium gonderi TaxID=77519 RepID=A0A1Y1JPM0_PLAGO|nr:conserved Plasmodium protein, unknown function [Plasmodium gonderi]GAW82782.1 conserved Plasmodium protein, unknown function [Plasmodium gonderi]
MDLINHYFYVVIVYLFFFFNAYTGIKVNPRKGMYRLNRDQRGNISMATISSNSWNDPSCHCSLMGRCFNKRKCNFLLFLLTGSTVMSVIIIGIFIQRATHLPLMAEEKKTIERKGNIKKENPIKEIAKRIRNNTESSPINANNVI